MINYGRLDRSISYYELHKFKRIESPWTVSEKISNLTKPIESTNLEIKNKNKVLVASGEQSFLYLYIKGFIPLEDKFQTITPCFRDDIFDQLHTKYFIKNELFITDNVCEDTLYKTIHICKEFFESELSVSVTLTELGKNQIDLEYNGMELGSYGIRNVGFMKYIYATGLAEPRMTMIKKYINNGK
jgi:hypothetical protein